jgi:hypothetical protein
MVKNEAAPTTPACCVPCTTSHRTQEVICVHVANGQTAAGRAKPSPP